MSQILVAGATGNLGRYVTQELKARGHAVRAMGRDEKRLAALPSDEVFRGDLLTPASLAGACDGVETVFSAAGASLGLNFGDRRSFLEVDYGGNLNLLKEARRAGVRKFVYVSLFGADRLAGVEYADAHEKFVAALKSSGLAYTIVRPTGFFSAFAAFVTMARRGGKGLVIGSGECRTNPIHEADLAAVCADAVTSSETEIPVGGPQTFTRRRIVEMAFESLGNTAHDFAPAATLQANDRAAQAGQSPYARPDDVRGGGESDRGRRARARAARFAELLCRVSEQAGLRVVLTSHPA